MSAHPSAFAEARVLARLLDNIPVPCRSLLDVGAGIGGYLHAIVAARPPPLLLHTIALDAHAPYLEHVTADEKLCGLALPLLRAMPARSVDVAICVDMIEHLEPFEGQLVLRELTRVVSRTALVFTPRGFHPQSGDAWNLGGEAWQEHRSGWMPETFPKPWIVEEWPGFYHGKPDLSPGALWATFRR